MARWLGRQEYLPVWRAMQHYTQQRDEHSPDEFWLLEHPPVFTQGQAGKSEHLLAPGNIPVVQADRGGQVTYHGPGQLVGYVLVDLRRRGIGVRQLVSAIEESIISVVAELGLEARARPDAPGVYLNGGDKIAQVGLRVRRGCTFHGLSLNCDMDLSPFQRINPCGHEGLRVTDIATELGVAPLPRALGVRLTAELAQRLGYHQWQAPIDSGLPFAREA